MVLIMGLVQEQAILLALRATEREVCRGGWPPLYGAVSEGRLCRRLPPLDSQAASRITNMWWNPPRPKKPSQRK